MYFSKYITKIDYMIEQKWSVSNSASNRHSKKKLFDPGGGPGGLANFLNFFLVRLFLFLFFEFFYNKHFPLIPISFLGREVHSMQNSILITFILSYFDRAKVISIELCTEWASRPKKKFTREGAPEGWQIYYFEFFLG